MALFHADSYWRDLVAFTWNICTQEGPDAIRTMLQARLADVKPTNFAVEDQATEAGGVIDAWFTFETAVARGAWPWPPAPEGRQGLDAADHDD